MDFPRLLRVQQRFPDRAIRDVAGEVTRELNEKNFAARIRPGGTVAIAAGSRGIANLATIVRAVVDYWKSHGVKPMIFPAMGSHGAASAEGQAEVLAHYGIREATMGCPVVSRLEVVSLGRTRDGIEAFMDRAAYECDGVMMVSRIKWHTDFTGKVESGLFKMMAIGLGKFAGAQNYHTHAFKLGLEHVILSVGRQVLASGKIIGGLAVLEDANHNTAKVEAVPAQGNGKSMEEREAELLALVKSWRGHIPARHLDILIIDQIGKNISGAGMDTKVVNRSTSGEYNPFPDTPRIERIFVRDLSPLSYGNAIGVGLADVVTDRLVKKIDWEPTTINSITASAMAVIRTPIHFADDRTCLEMAARTVGRFSPLDVQIGWIRNTMQLSRAFLSENLRDEIEQNPNLTIEGPPIPMEFDASGNLPDLLATPE